MTASRQGSLDLNLPELSFREDAGDVLVDVEQLMLQRLVIQGSSGSGKSHFVRSLLEQTIGRLVHLVFDWEGEFRTLKELHPYVVIGRYEEGDDWRPDLELSIDSARMLARRLYSAGASVIVDLSTLEDYQDRREYVGRYLDSLIKLRYKAGDRRWRLLTVVDEAQEFCPQTGGDEYKESSIALKRLAARGRKRGICPVFATQRIAKLHKDLECQNKAFGKTTQDVDITRSADDLGFNKQDARQFKKLKAGEWFVVGAAIGDGNVQMVRTAPTLTKPPLEHVPYTPPPAGEEVVSALHALAEESRHVATDAGATELLEHIARLEKQLADAKAGNSSDPADIRRAVEAAKAPLQEQIDYLFLQLQRAMNHARAILLDMGEVPPKAEEALSETAPPTEAAEATDAEADESNLDPKQIEMLGVLTSRGEMSRHDLAVATDQGVKSGKMRALLGDLKRRGLIVYPGPGCVAIAPKETP